MLKLNFNGKSYLFESQYNIKSEGPPSAKGKKWLEPLKVM